MSIWAEYPIYVRLPVERFWPTGHRRQLNFYSLGDRDPEVMEWLVERIGPCYHWQDSPDGLWTHTTPVSTSEVFFGFREEARDVALLFKLTFGGL